MTRVAVLACCALLPAVLHAQGGVITGRVSEQNTDVPISGAIVELDRGLFGAVTDANGEFRIAEVRPGRHRVRVRAVAYRSVERDSVAVASGQTVTLHIALALQAVQIEGVVVQGEPDPLLDPRVTETRQTIGGADVLRQLPITRLEEAVAVQAGVVDGSFRGGRLGQDALVLDGLAVKNQLDASTGTLGLSIPPVALADASLVTHGFSARYGQALSGVVTAVTRDGGDHLRGHLQFETDRPLPAGWDAGIDRVVGALDGPLVGGIRFLAAVDAEGRLDADPVNAPIPRDILDPRHDDPWLLRHNAGERVDAVGKLTVPLGSRQTLRVLGAASAGQRLLFDPVLKYAPKGSGERVTGRLWTAHLERVSRPDSLNTTIVELRVGYFEKEATRAPVMALPDHRFGAFSFEGLELTGRDLARRRDSVAAMEAIPGFEVPVSASETPWGVPGLFMTASSRGELAWNRFRELRGRLDLFLGRGPDTDLRTGLEYVRQRVETFTRLEAYRSVADGAPRPTVSAFDPMQAAAYLEWQQRFDDLTMTGGLRADLFNPRGAGEAAESKTKLALGPRFAVSTALEGATVVASVGRFAQPPDYQYLTDVAFDDTLRTGRIRRGNAGLGFETSTQYELQVRLRPQAGIGIKVGVYVRRLDGLVASVPIGLDPDSAVFGNADFADVRGVEAMLEREFGSAFAARVSYVLQKAEATATDARDFFRRVRISDITGDTIAPAVVSFPLNFDRRHAVTLIARGRVPQSAGPILAGLEGGLIGRWGSGLPYSRTNTAGDSLIGLPNSHRLPSQVTVDLLLRRQMRLGGTEVAAYLDVRNLSDRRNVVAVRRDTGSPEAGEPQIEATAARALAEHPGPIPYESRRYRAWADVDGDGLIAGDELVALYERAARDFLQPLFAYGPPRLVRVGVEIAF